MDEQTEVTHPDWCLPPYACQPKPDGSVTHAHVQAVVSDVARVLVEQVDTRDEDGNLRPGKPKVVTEFPQGARLTNKDWRRVTHWQSRVALLTGESTRPGGAL